MSHRNTGYSPKLGRHPERAREASPSQAFINARLPPEDVEKRVDPEVIGRVLREAIGITIPELSEDLTSRLRDPLLGFDIHPELPFKGAKRRFKEDYIRAALQRRFGNISEVARLLKLSRRTVHRLAEQTEVRRMREDMAPARYFAEQDIGAAIGETMREYADVLHPSRLERLYEKVPQLSAELLRDAEYEPIPLEDALREFERRYLIAAVSRHGPVLKDVARKTGLRYETLLRKLRAVA